MREEPCAFKVTASGGFLISATALHWLLSDRFRSMHFSGLDRLGYICGILCALGATGISWAGIIAHVGRSYEWSPRKCATVAQMSFLLLAGIFWVMNPALWRVALFAVNLAYPVGNACRKLAYPEITQEQLDVPEPPLTLFPR
jgi:hypothetical protein